MSMIGLLAATGALWGAAAAQADGPNTVDECAAYTASGVDAAQCAGDLAEARAATAKYRDVSKAKLDGFVKFTDCEASPEGAMGEHWARVDRMVVPALDVAAPEILLYMPTSPGRVLLGAEYERTALFGGLPSWGASEPKGTVSARPSMFGGMQFDGPMAGHSPIQPWHYDLHVWLWKPNPAGLFAQYNPSFGCSE